MKTLPYLTVLIIILATGCTSTGTSQNQAGTDFPMKITDGAGENITLSAAPTRIVSLAPSNTEILFVLGLGEQIVGVTEYGDYPEEALEKEQIGGFNTISTEKVVALNPGLILATGGVQAEVVEQLRGLNQQVVVIDSKNLDDILSNIQLIGRITGRTSEAQTLVKDLQKRIDAARAKGKSTGVKVMYIVWGDPLMVAGPDSFADDLIVKAGGVNIYADAATQYPSVTLESVINRNPEVIIASDNIGLELEDLKDLPEWRETSAVQNGRLYTIDADIVSRPGPRIVDALELFAGWIEHVDSENL
ncbi:MAG: cobalamin-binding protein [Candidatus Hydrothermarchaeales archaeon]